ncbi:MAG: PEP-CTERM sorting domain-containing protein [Acidobacteriota bacterium]
MRAYILGLFSCLVMVPMASAAVVWDESVDGDLSGNFASPDPLSFSIGANTVLGATGRPATTAPSERDYFTFTIPNGYFLLSIKVLEGTNFERPEGAGFLAIQGGTAVIDPTTMPSSALAAALLGYTHYKLADVGTDILPRLAGSNNPPAPFPPAIGFSLLGAGTYSVWIQDTGVSETPLPYGFEFTLATPEPGTWATGLAGLLGLAFLRRKR